MIKVTIVNNVLGSKSEKIFSMPHAIRIEKISRFRKYHVPYFEFDSNVIQFD